MRLGIVTGLKREADCLSGPVAGETVDVRCSGADADRAERQARRLLETGCRALASFGLAGGLAPHLKAGALIIPVAVLAPSGERYPAASNWRLRVIEALPRNSLETEAPLAGADRLTSTVEEKSSLHAATGAAAVDMESHRVGRIAAKAGVPFLCLRAVSDDASTALPAWVAQAVKADGSTHYGSILKALASRPAEIGTLLRLSRDSETAFATLRRVTGLAGPLLRFA